MTNWSKNAVHFTGNKGTINAIYSSIKPHPREESLIFDYDALQPMPTLLSECNWPLIVVDDETFQKKEEERLLNIQKAETSGKPTYMYDRQYVSYELYDQIVEESGGYDDWSQWCSDNRGTKWTGYDVEVKHKDSNALTLTYRTAWQAPIFYYEFLRNKFPDLKIVAGFFESYDDQFVLCEGATDEFMDLFSIVEYTEEDSDIPEEEWYRYWEFITRKHLNQTTNELPHNAKIIEDETIRIWCDRTKI